MKQKDVLAPTPRETSWRVRMGREQEQEIVPSTDLCPGGPPMVSSAPSPGVERHRRGHPTRAVAPALIGRRLDGRRSREGRGPGEKAT